jgi:hypothetical protein
MSKEKTEELQKAKIVHITLQDIYEMVLTMKDEISELRTDVDKLIENGGK